MTFDLTYSYILNIGIFHDLADLKTAQVMA